MSLLGSARSKAITIAATAALLVAGTAVPAAASEYLTLRSSSWSYVDSAAPKTAFANPAGDAPIGAKVAADHKKHVTKSYFTFDLSGLRGAKVLDARLTTGETAVADCTAPRGTELRVTAPAKKAPTWADQPRELGALPGRSDPAECPAEFVGWDAETVLQQAIDAGRPALTLVLRLPDDQQYLPRFGRTYRPVLSVSMQKNHPPTTPVNLKAGQHACAETPLVQRGGAAMSAQTRDPDDYSFSAEFAWWPVDHPDRRATGIDSYVNGTEAYYDPDAQLADGVTYAWQVRAKDSLATSAWSEICRFTTDFTAPATAPTVTSTDYVYEVPGKGGIGIPGDFTLDAGGDPQIVGFRWEAGYTDSGYVAADRPGGTATVRYTPRSDGPMNMSASGVDAAGNTGPSGAYRFFVARNGPTMTCTPARAFLGETRRCTFGPHGTDGATEYVYKIDDGPETTLPAGPDGTAAITVTPTDVTRSYDVSVRARMTNGNLSGPGGGRLDIDRGLPVIDVPADAMVGRPVVFTLHATLPGSTSFTYDWDNGEPVTVPVGPDGTAQVTIVPETPYSHWLAAHTTTAAGLVSATKETYVPVATNGPVVTSTDFPSCCVGGYVTTPGTFTFSSPLPGVVSYTYAHYRGAEGTVPAGPDGTASVVLTPLSTDTQYLTVTSTFADGSVSKPGYYSFSPKSAAPPLTCDLTGNARPGQVVHCTLTPVQPGLAAYGYQLAIGGESGPEVAVRPGADGTGTFEFTAPATETKLWSSLRAWSANAAGQRTDTSSTVFYVDPDAGAAAKPGVRAV
ncbi:DNRLRE domain-containing protein [Amycolatopsis kentuckyensis]|uniref:DNRLRE domain-containing protein n=1 Tax=Amycolatopsis kentuckyensis TaxID=218823 RepID=UPI001ABF0DFB|nr:DNRLRE domain-containing protein [Amycolatopsis kentuckyensis]